MDTPILASENIPNSATTHAGLLDCAQAAHYLSISESFVRKSVASNKIPYVRIGTRTLFRRSDLDEWVSAHVVRTYEDLASQAQTMTSRARLSNRQNRRSAL